MQIHLTPLVLALSAVFCAGVAQAEKADRSKPMNIEADALRHDDLKQTSVFTGRVVMTKGSIVIRGARLDVRQDADGYQLGVVTAEPGKRAFFRQKRDGPGDEFIEGEGETIEYDGRADKVRFIRKAEMRRYRATVLGDELNGDVIVYDSLTDVFTVDGGGGAAGRANAGNSGGRVRAVLAPKSSASVPAPASGPASAAGSPSYSPVSGSGGEPATSGAPAAAFSAEPAAAPSASPALRQSTTLGGGKP